MNTPEKPIPTLLTRRSVIGRGLTVAIGSAMVPGLAASGNEVLDLPDSHIAYALPEDHWANLVEHKFQVKGLSFNESEIGFRRTTLVLLETCQCVPQRADLARPLWLKSFATSLLFRGPKHLMLENRSHRIEHRWLGEFDLLLNRTPLEKYQGQNVYEAIINN